MKVCFLFISAEGRIDDGNGLVRGTHITQSEDYKERNGMFQCINSKVIYLSIHRGLISIW